MLNSSSNQIQLLINDLLIKNSCIEEVNWQTKVKQLHCYTTAFFEKYGKISIPFHNCSTKVQECEMSYTKTFLCMSFMSIELTKNACL